jgi:hypothetical protein
MSLLLPCIFSVHFSQFTFPPFPGEFQAARLSMSIRSITVERGIATLAHQSHLPTLLSLSRISRNTGDKADGSSVEAISSRTGVPARQDSQEVLEEERELEGDNFDDSGGPGWWRDDPDEADENETIRQGDTRIISTGAVTV